MDTRARGWILIGIVAVLVSSAIGCALTQIQSSVRTIPKLSSAQLMAATTQIDSSCANGRAPKFTGPAAPGTPGDFAPASVLHDGSTVTALRQSSDRVPSLFDPLSPPAP